MRQVVTGLRAWLVQRLSAVYMLFFLLLLLFHFLVDPPASYVAWNSWVRTPGVSIAFLLFFAAMLSHAWVGVRDVILDYVHPAAVRAGSLAAWGLALMVIAAWALRILFMPPA